MFYKLLKNYKEIDNHNIKGKTITLKRIPKRSILIKFYSDTLNIENNYFPIYQKYFLLKNFLDQQLILEPSLKNNFYYNYLINKSLKLYLNKTQFNLNDNIFFKYLDSFSLKRSLIFYQKKIF
jgi:hypothetical protein